MRPFSQKTISRVLRYSRLLDEERKDWVSSAELAARSGFSDAQVRKDISSFGRVGRPRVGYNVIELKRVFDELVHQNTVHVALFGVGHLGSAILRYPGFDKERIQFVAAFERDASKAGTSVNGIEIFDVKDAPKVVRRAHAEIGVNATPVETSQEVADLMVAAGLKGIINFAPVTLTVPPGVFVRNIDFTLEFLSLFCDVQGATVGKK